VLVCGEKAGLMTDTAMLAHSRRPQVSNATCKGNAEPNALQLPYIGLVKCYQIPMRPPGDVYATRALHSR